MELEIGLVCIVAEQEEAEAVGLLEEQEGSAAAILD